MQCSATQRDYLEPYDLTRVARFKHLIRFRSANSRKQSIRAAAQRHLNSEELLSNKWRETNENFSTETGAFVIASPPFTRLPSGPLIILIKLINATGIPCYTF